MLGEIGVGKDCHGQDLGQNQMTGEIVMDQDQSHGLDLIPG